jgi:tetratricopeptide (TPR) repeat protein
MVINKRLATFVGSLGLTVALAGGTVAWAEEQTAPATDKLHSQAPEFVAGQLANLNRLINSSSGALRIEASGNEAALALREEARGTYAEATKAFESGDMVQADAYLKQASRTMFEAVRAAGAGEAGNRRKRDDFEGRAEAVRVLLDAMLRVSEEKGSAADGQKVKAKVDAAVTDARALLANEKYDEARRILDGAYETAKGAVEKLRDGDTLVRSLDFASKEEEYHYEVDRNETHKMLVQVLLEEKRNAGTLNKMVDGFLEEARRLRGAAEAEAASGDYAAAVTTLEESTKQLQRAIRAGGVYIPG